MPPSATLAVAPRLTVVTSASSLTVVATGVVLSTRLSKLPPLADTMAVLTLAPPPYTSSGAIAVTVPLEAPTGIDTACPLASSTATGLPVTGAVRFTV